MILEYDDESIVLNEGDVHTVKTGRYHKPISKEECHVLLVENKMTLHTGNIIGPYTKSIKDQQDK